MSSSKSAPKSNTMPAAKKTAVPAAATPPAPAVAAAAAKTPRKAAAKSEVTVPVVDSAAAAAPAVAADAAETRPASVILTELQEHLKTLGTEWSTRVRALVAEAGEALKALKRDVRNSKRRVKKDPATMTPEEKATWEARRANNAFLKLRPITDELASFMGLSPKSQRSQTDVTKFISTYVKTHSCFDPNFKRRIIPDAKLGKLLRVKDGQEVTYLNLQSFLKVHFIKTDAAAVKA
jgi:chromatin remodeling complex protein RSC6